MKTLFPRAFFYVALLMLPFAFSSCKKSGDAATSSFTWTHAGKSYQPTFFSAFSGTGYTFTPFHIVAGFGNFPSGFYRRIDFHTSSFAVGSYSIVPPPGTVNTLDYIDDAGFNLAGVSGTLNITANANNQLSGNFSVTIIDASSATSLMTGSFTNISISP